MKNRCAIFSFKFDVKIRVAWYIAAADQPAGSGSSIEVEVEMKVIKVVLILVLVSAQYVPAKIKNIPT